MAIRKIQQTISGLTIPLFCFVVTTYTIQAEELDANWTSNLQTFRSVLLPRNESKLKPEESRLRLQANWLNIWSLQDERFLIDGEEVSVVGTWRTALNKRNQVGIRFGLVHQAGGILDESIEIFHRSTGVSQSQRDKYPRNKLKVRYEPYGTYYPVLDRSPGESLLRAMLRREIPRQSPEPPVDLNNRNALASLLNDLIEKRIIPPLETSPLDGSARSGVADPRLFLQSTLYQSNSWMKSLHSGLELKVPVYGGELIGSPGLDVSLSLTASFEFNKKLLGSVGVSWTTFGSTNYRFIKLPDEQWAIRPGLRWLFPDWELFVEYVYFTQPSQNFGELSSSGNQIATGIRFDVEKGKATFAIIENLINFGITPDIGFQAGYELYL